MVNMDSNNNLKTYKALVDDAFRNTILKLRMDKAAEILPEALKHLSREEFKDLEDYVFERLEK